MGTLLRLKPTSVQQEKSIDMICKQARFLHNNTLNNANVLIRILRKRNIQ